MPQLKALFDWVDTFPTSTVIRESVIWFPALLTIHVVSMCLFAGLVLMMDLRLLGVGNMRTPFSEVQRRLWSWQVVGITINAITGFILVYGQPLRYYGNVFFWIKMLIMTFLALNAAAFHIGTYQSIEDWDTKRIPPFGAKVAAVVSLALWPVVIAFGRLMAYNWFNPI
jgi:hypothetical protein